MPLFFSVGFIQNPSEGHEFCIVVNGDIQDDSKVSVYKEYHSVSACRDKSKKGA